MQQLNVTEQNIANVNTEGYSRQRILTSAKEPATSVYLISQLTKALVGQGVEMTGVQQIRSTYLDQQYRNLNSEYNYNTARDSSLTYLDGLYNELDEDSGMTTAIGNFFSALNTFSSNTSSKENRTNVQQQGLSMTQSFNNVYEEMQSLWNDQNDSISTVSQEINAIAQKLAKLNDSIAGCVQTGGTANDLKDERNLLLDQLSGYVNISYSVNTDNAEMVDVKIGGMLLVEGKNASQISIDRTSNHQTAINNILTAIANDNLDPVANAADLALQKNALQALGNFTFPANSSGGMDVKLGGAALVTDTAVTSTIEDAADSSLTAWIEFHRNNLTLNGNMLSIESGTVTSGKLYANIELVENQSALSPGIPYYMNQLNTLVREIAENLNTINRSGYTYPDGAAPSITGVNMFEVPSYIDPVSGATVYDYSKVTAGSFSLSDEVLDSAYNIAGSSSPVVLNGDSTESGNNEIALKLFKDLTNSAYYDKLNSIVINLAIASKTSTSIMDTQKSLLKSVDTQRQSTSAVSLDEETTNLIMFQQSYNACSRIITTLNDMLDTLINSMGRS